MFSLPKRAFGVVSGEPVSMFSDPDQIIALLSASGWEAVRVTALAEPAWLGSDAADVMGYLTGMRMVNDLIASAADASAAARALAALAGEYVAREREDGVRVTAAAWLVTASRSEGQH